MHATQCDMVLESPCDVQSQTDPPCVMHVNLRENNQSADSMLRVRRSTFWAFVQIVLARCCVISHSQHTLLLRLCNMAAPNNPAVGALLADDVASLEERWAELSEEALLEEITRYRDAIKSLASDINRLGASGISPECPLPMYPPPPSGPSQFVE